MHQALRFFPDESVGYTYPEMYLKLFGPDYKPEPYIVAEYERAQEPQVVHDLAPHHAERRLLLRPQRQGEPGRLRGHHRPQLKQPKEGLGWDSSPSAHMWRTIMWPTPGS